MSTPIFDFWNDKDKDHTLHTGAPWPGEERRSVQFYAMTQPFPGAEPIHDFWNDKQKDHTFHVGGAWPDEVQGENVQFYAFKEQKPHTQPVYNFWSDKNVGYSFHFGEPWPDEKKGDVQFYAYPEQLTWHDDAPCDGPTAQSRKQWLVENKGLSEEAAKQQVMSEFPQAFLPGAPSGGDGKGGGKGSGGDGHFVDGAFPHTLRIVQDSHGRNRLQISVRPRNASEVTLVAVHYGVNGSGETMNFDIRHPQGDAYVHTTPDFGPVCNPGDNVTYWLAAIVNGLIQEMPEGACPNPAARLHWTAA